MITLHGFAISNYYNKVKLVLLEKGLPFEEKYLGTRSTDEAVLAATPLAKVPYISTEQGTLCESEVIVEYLEALCPTPALLPAEPFAAAKVRELVTFIELHLELEHASSTRRPSSAARCLMKSSSAWASSSSATSTASSAWRTFRPMSAATRSIWPIAPPTSACRWWLAPARPSTVKTC